MNLLAYHFSIEYVNTESFAYVNTLSRLINQNNYDEDEYVLAAVKIEQQIHQVISTSLQSIPIKFDQIKEAYKSDTILQQLIKLTASNWENDTDFMNDPVLNQFYNRREHLTSTNDIVMFSDRIVIPTILRENVIKELHKGHPGIDRMKNLARAHVYWPNIDKQIENFVKTCKKCALQGKAPTKTTLQPWPVPANPWERIHIDYAGPFKHTHFLIIIDAHSKWPEIIETKSTTSAKTIEILTSIFARFGSPLQIVSDNRPQFTSEQFQSFCNINRIEHIRTSPYHPMSNGQAERFVDTFKRAMNKLEGEGKLNEILQTFLMTYRSTPNKNCPSNKSPAEMLLGRKIRSTLDLLKPTTMTYSDPKTKMEDQFNKKHGAKDREFDVGDSIYVQIHASNSWHWEEGIILERFGKVNYLVSTKYREVRAHTNQVKKRFADSSPDTTNQDFNTFLGLFFDDPTCSEPLPPEDYFTSSPMEHAVDDLIKLMESLRNFDGEMLEP